MPVRRLNFTNRERIAHTDIDIVLRTNAEATTFDARLSIDDYGFPADARVIVEAYRQTAVHRFDYGTVSLLRPPTDRSLVEFDTPVEVLFRLKVTAASVQPGLLLGEADQIRPREPDEQPDRRIPLLPPVPDELDEELWRVEFGRSTLLRVSRHLPDWKQTVRTPEFRALVYPAAMRQILERILHIDGVTDIDDLHDWHCRWLKFASTLPGSRAVPKLRDEFDDWIEEAVSAFARQERLRTRYQQGITE